MKLTQQLIEKISEALIDSEIVFEKLNKLKGVNKEDLDITYVTEMTT